MEIKITKFLSQCCMRDYSASAAELGDDAGKITWQAAQDDAPDWHFLQENDAFDTFRVFVRASGGWSADEVAEMSDATLEALCLQWIAGDVREAGLDDGRHDDDSAWEQYEEDAEAGRVSGRIFRADGEVYWYCGE